jgi:hypothetical protein
MTTYTKAVEIAARHGLENDANAVEAIRLGARPLIILHIRKLVAAWKAAQHHHLNLNH